MQGLGGAIGRSMMALLWLAVFGVAGLVAVFAGLVVSLFVAVDFWLVLVVAVAIGAITATVVSKRVA